MSDQGEVYLTDHAACREALASWIESYADPALRQGQPPFWFSILGDYQSSLRRQLKLSEDDFHALLVTAGLMHFDDKQKACISLDACNAFFFEFCLSILHKDVCEMTVCRVDLNKLRLIEFDDVGNKLQRDRADTYFIRLGNRANTSKRHKFYKSPATQLSKCKVPPRHWRLSVLSDHLSDAISSRLFAAMLNINATGNASFEVDPETESKAKIEANEVL